MANRSKVKYQGHRQIHGGPYSVYKLLNKFTRRTNSDIAKAFNSNCEGEALGKSMFLTERVGRGCGVCENTPNFIEIEYYLAE